MSPTKRYTSLEVTAQLRAIGRRFRDISWIMIALLIATGMANLVFLGSLEQLPALLIVDGPFKLKMIVFGVMIVTKFLHDFVVGPKAILTNRGSLLWRGALFLGRLNLVLGLGLLYFALQIRGG